MVEPDKQNPTDLESTVRHLREENAKLMQLLRSQGLLPDISLPSTNKSSDPQSSNYSQSSESSSLTFDHSDFSSNTSHQHQSFVNNSNSIVQGNFHGNPSNVTANLTPVIHNSSPTFVQNNNNLIQPINLMNMNNASLESIQSIFSSPNSLLYPSPSSSTGPTPATTTSTTSTTSSSSSTVTASSTPPTHHETNYSSESHPISIRPKAPSLLHPHQELVPVIPKIRAEQFESIQRQYSSSSINNETSNLLDNDSNDSKQKYPRPIRPKPSSRSNALQVYKSVMVHENNSSSSAHLNPSPTVSLFSSSTCSSPSSSSNTYHEHSLEHHSSTLIHSQSFDMSIPPTNNLLNATTNGNSKKALNQAKNRLRNRNKAPSNNSMPVPIAPNLGRPLAPAPINVQRSVTSNNPITKRSSTTKKSSNKRQSKSLVQCHSESILPSASSPSNAFADSISGFLENFNQELIKSNILSQDTPSTGTTSNLLTDDALSSNTNSMRTLDQIDLRHLVNGALQRHESYQSTSTTLEDFQHDQNSNTNDMTATTTTTTTTTNTDFHVEAEQIPAFISDEDMHFVEMNFDENTFLKQFDLDDPSLRLNVQSEQNLFANLLTNPPPLSNSTLNPHPQSDFIPAETSHPTTISSTAPTAAPSMYSGSSLINNNVFTTVVPLGSQQSQHLSSSSSLVKTTIISQTSVSTFLPEEGVQLTARHIEPRQVATYDSVKYQDILDDLVMVTDQDALRHAQAAAAGEDPSIVSTDFTFALIEATNEIIKDPHLQVLDATTTAALTELQYFYPIEQEQELLQKQLEICQDKQIPEQSAAVGEALPAEPIVILEKLQAEILVSADLTKTVLDESSIQTAITDLSSLLQFESTHSSSTAQPTTHEETESSILDRTATMDHGDLLTVHHPTTTTAIDTVEAASEKSPPQESQPIDFDAFFSSEPSPPKILPPPTPPPPPHQSSETDMNTSSSTVTDQFTSPVEDLPAAVPPSPPPPPPPPPTHMTNSQSGTVPPKPCILFEPISSPSNPSSPVKTLDEEMVMDSGSIGPFTSVASTVTLTEDEIDRLLTDQIHIHRDPYEMIESPQPISRSPMINMENEEHEQRRDVEDLLEVEEEEQPMIEHPKFVPTPDHTFHRYRERYRMKMKHEQQQLRMKKSQEQSLTVPPVKLKLNAIFLHKNPQKKKKKRSPSPVPPVIPSTSISLLPAETEPVSPSPPPPPSSSSSSTPTIKEIDEKPLDRPPLKITIRTKIPLPPVAAVSEASSSSVPKLEKEEPKKVRKTKKKKSNHSTQQTKKKVNNPPAVEPETEYAGLTRFERPLAQLYHQPRPPTPDESQLKHEMPSPSPPIAAPASIESNPTQSNPVPHSGFMIDEQTPPSSITSIEHKNSPPPLLSSQTVNEKLKLNYSHLFGYDHHEQPNNNTFITPPPEIDFHPQQQQQQQKNSSLDNFYPFSTSPNKKRHQSRKSSVTSSSSSKSLPTTEYAIDSQALEPVSPTPLSSSSSTTSISKSKHSLHSSSSTLVANSTSSSTIVPSSCNEISPNYFDHHQQQQQQQQQQSKSTKDHHSSSKKSSSSSRSSKTTSSQSYSSSRSLSNHSYRTSQESPVLGPMLPPSIAPPPSSLHLDPYAQSYHHFTPRASPASFFNFPFPHPFLNPHAAAAAAAAAAPSHFHPHHSMKYHHPAAAAAAHHPHHGYPTHQTAYPYHPHLPRQQQYNNTNYMSSRDHHSYER